MEEILKTLAQFTDCLAQHYYKKEQAIEILTKSNIDFLSIDISGSPRDLWWNIIQYISNNDPTLMGKLTKVAYEENPTSSCLPKLKNKYSMAEVTLERTIAIDNQHNEISNIKGLGLTSNKLNRAQEQIATTLSNSFAVGLIENLAEGISSTGFLIATNLVVMPTFVINDLSNIIHLTFTINRPLLATTKQYSFETKPHLYNPEKHIMVLQLQENITGIEPLKIAQKTDLEKLNSEAISLISFANLNKSITTVSNLTLDNQNLMYQTASANGSAGGAIFMGKELIGMHVGGRKDGFKEGIDLTTLL